MEIKSAQIELLEEKYKPEGPYVAEAIKLMRNNPEVILCSPKWVMITRKEYDKLIQIKIDYEKHT